MPRRPRRLPNRRQHIERLRDGLDTDTTWPVPAGRMQNGRNFELDVSGSPQDIDGYERFDGRAAPSDAGYLILTPDGAVEDEDAEFERFSDANSALPDTRQLRFGPNASNETVYLRQIGRLGDILIAADQIENEDGSLNANAGPLTTTGNESFRYFSSRNRWDPVGPGDGTLARIGQSSLTRQPQHFQMLAASGDVRRARIESLPGAGPVLGLWVLGGKVFGARNSSDSTQVRVHKATANGWADINVGETPVRQVRFVMGNKTGGTPGFPDEVTHVTQSGTNYDGRGASDPKPQIRLDIDAPDNAWGTGAAKGVIVFHDAVGLQNGAATITADNGFTGELTIVGTTFELLPGGLVETDTGNFGYGERIYGVDSRNPAFEFDAETESMLQIDTGNTDDTPDHVAWHINRLWLAFGRSMQNSGVGSPFAWEVISGASEIAMPDTINSLHVEPGESGNAALAVFTRHRISVLYGTSSENWNLAPYRAEVGALPKTVQEIGQTIFLDDRGIRYLSTVQAFGNFSHATLTEHIQTHINEILAVATPVGSCIVRKKNQYRIFFDNGDALYLTFRGERLMGAMPIFFERQISVITSAEDSATGDERIFFGGENGRVYELDKGRSFDGAPISAYMRLHPNYVRGRQGVGLLKRWIQATVQAQGTGYAEYAFSFASFDDTDAARRTAGQSENISRYVEDTWDLGVWDVGRWDGGGTRPVKVKLAGEGEHITFTIIKRSDWMSKITVSAIVLEFIMRRMLR